MMPIRHDRWQFMDWNRNKLWMGIFWENGPMHFVAQFIDACTWASPKTNYLTFRLLFTLEIWNELARNGCVQWTHERFIEFCIWRNWIVPLRPNTDFHQWWLCADGKRTFFLYFIFVHLCVHFIFTLFCRNFGFFFFVNYLMKNNESTWIFYFWRIGDRIIWVNIDFEHDFDLIKVQTR